MIIGIDPGRSGGLAILNDTQCVGHVAFNKVTDYELWQMLAESESSTVILEKVSSSPQMGVVSAFTFGQSYGTIRMACIAAGLRLVEVSPQRWQKTLGLKSSGAKLGGATENKRRNKALAQELFPGIKITNATADALLLAEYGRRVEGNGQCSQRSSCA